jgi:hypothetical protein
MYEKSCLNLYQYNNNDFISHHCGLRVTIVIKLHFKTLIMHAERISIAKSSLRYTCEGTFQSVKSVLSWHYLHHVDRN